MWEIALPTTVTIDAPVVGSCEQLNDLAGVPMALCRVCVCVEQRHSSQTVVLQV